MRFTWLFLEMESIDVFVAFFSFQLLVWNLLCVELDIIANTYHAVV